MAEKWVHGLGKKKCLKDLAQYIKEISLHPADSKVSCQLLGGKNDIKVTHDSRQNKENWKKNFRGTKNIRE